MPVKGLRRSQLLTLGAIFVYYLVLLYLFEQRLSFGNGITLFAVPVIYDHASFNHAWTLPRGACA
jgi:hypothetical protein